MIDFSNIEAVGFDLDGTLVDSRIAFAKAFYQLIRDWGLEEKPIEKLTPLVGIHVTELFEHLGVGQHRRNEFFDHLDAIYPGIAESEMSAFEGTQELLQSLKFAGKKIALITSNSTQGAKMSLEICGISDAFFDEIITSCNTDNQKPHPEPISKALKLFKVEPSRFMYFGDTIADYTSAMAAGVNFKLLTHNEGTEHDEKVCSSHHIPSIEAIRHYLGKK